MSTHLRSLCMCANDHKIFVAAQQQQRGSHACWQAPTAQTHLRDIVCCQAYRNHARPCEAWLAKEDKGRLNFNCVKHSWEIHYRKDGGAKRPVKEAIPLQPFTREGVPISSPAAYEAKCRALLASARKRWNTLDKTSASRYASDMLADGSDEQRD